MNPHINRIISAIRTKNPKIDLKNFENAFFYNGYFSGFDLTPNKLSPSVNAELRRRMKLALERIVETQKTLFIFWLVLTPFTYFFGSILRDMAIDTVRAYPGSIDYYLWYFIWIMSCIVYPIGYAIKFFNSSSGLNAYIKSEFANQSNTIDTDSIIIKNNSNKTHKERLVELEDLLNDNLISEEEYNLKKKDILKDL